MMAWLKAQKSGNIDVLEQENNVTGLIIAAEEGFKEVVNVLLKHGARINEQDYEGKTALFLAAQKGT